VQNVLDEITFWNNVIIRPIVYVLKIISGIQIALGSAQKFPAFAGVVTGICAEGMDTGETLNKVINILQIPGNILSCNPNTGWEWYDNWQSSILDQYNYIASGRYFEDLGAPGVSEAGQIITVLSGRDPDRARNLRDNLFVSTAGLCLPGIVENLEKMGQIQCRYVYCLETEVAKGIPVSICDDSRGQMWCKYVFDELMGFIPIFSPLELLSGSLKQTVQDPIGTALSINWNFCAASCPLDSGAAGWCSVSTVITSLFQQVMSFPSAIDARETIDRDYCSLIED